MTEAVGTSGPFLNPEEATVKWIITAEWLHWLGGQAGCSLHKHYNSKQINYLIVNNLFSAWKIVHQTCLKFLISIIKLSWLPVVERWSMQHVVKATTCLSPPQIFAEIFRCRVSLIYVPYLPQTR